MNKIFISYRREDSAAICGRIYDRLWPRFGRENVFKDVEGIPLGVNFEDYIGQVVEKCVVQLVVIGPSWLAASTEDGRRRLDDPNDLVRLEIEAALKRSIPVIPVYVQGAQPPHFELLPTTLQELTRKNGTNVGNDPYFDPDVTRLITGLENWLLNLGTPPVSTSEGPRSQDAPQLTLPAGYSAAAAGTTLSPYSAPLSMPAAGVPPKAVAAETATISSPQTMQRPNMQPSASRAPAWFTYPLIFWGGLGSVILIIALAAADPNLVAIGTICNYAVAIYAAVKAAQLKRWGWVVALFLLGAFAATAFGLKGPTTEAQK